MAKPLKKGRHNCSELPQSVLIVMVNFHKARRLLDGIRSVRIQTICEDIYIRVIDNSCDGQEADLLAACADELGYELIVSGRNLGYTKACNLGAQSWSGKLIVFMNPDIIIEESDFFERLNKVLPTNERFLATVAQVNDDGSSPEILRLYPKPYTLVMRRFMKRAELELPIESNGLVRFDWVQSSFLIVPASLWRAIGGFDERYFLFMADIEICRAARAFGADVLYLPQLRVRADGRRASAGSVFDIAFSPVLRIHVADAARYFWSRATERICRILAIRS